MKDFQKILVLTVGLSIVNCAPASFKVAGQKLDPAATSGAIVANPGSNDASAQAGPGVTVKANGSESDLQTQVDSEISVDWMSRGATDCVLSQDDQAVATGTSGTFKSKAPSTPATIRFSSLCQTPSGPVADDINVVVVPMTNPSPTPTVEKSKSSEGQDPNGSITAELKVNGETSNIEIPHSSTVQVAWSSEGASDCQVEPGSKSGLSGIYNLERLTANVVVTLTCKNNADTVVISRNVMVTPPGPPVIDLKINGSDGPLVAPLGSPLKITWTSLQSTQCTLTINGQMATTGLQGDLERTAGDQLTQHTLKCDGPGGTATDTVVTAPSVLLPQVTITAQGQPDMVEVAPDAPVKLDWNSTNATQCAVTPGPYQGTSGTQMVGPLTQKTTYTALCEGPFGLASATVVVIPKSPQMEIALTINGSPTGVTVPKNSTVKVSWTSTNAKSCQIQPFNFTGLSGKDIASTPIVQSVKVQLICVDANNTSKMVEVPITTTDDAKSIPAIDLKVNGSDGPLYVETNAVLQIVWVTKNVTECKLNQTMDVEANGTKNLSVSTDSKMTLTCKYGTLSISDEVEIIIRPKGVSACKVGVNIKDGGGWSKSTSQFHGVALCSPSGNLKIFGQEVVSQSDQTLTFKMAKMSTCEHDVTILLKNPNNYSGAFKSSQTSNITLPLKKDQVIEVQITNTKGCIDQKTRSSLDKTWTLVTANQCLVK